MPTLKLAVVPAKQLKNGNHKIRIAIGHKNETRYIVTRFEINDLSQFKDGQVVNTNEANITNRKLRNRLNDCQDALDKINPDNFSPSQLRDYLKGCKIKTSSFKSFTTDTIIKDLITEKKIGTSGLYKRSLKYFIEFNGNDISFDLITPQMIKHFDQFLMNIKGLNQTTRGMHHARVKHIINEAIKQKIIKYETHPYAYYVKSDPIVRELDITVDEFRKIRDCKVKTKPLRMAHDLFLLSYYLGGINLIDLMEIDFKGAKTITYIREKSKNTKKGEKRVSLTIQPEAEPIIKEWMGRNGKLDFGYKYSYENFRNYVTKQIHVLANMLEIENVVVYYSARKSVVQHGFDLGINLEILEYSIGQSMKKNRPIFNYVKIMRKHADAAMRTILDHIK